MNSAGLSVCVVGAGPRGLSVLERICARERKSARHTSVTVHVVDPARPGAGQVWRTAQPHHLLMNTVACQITMFTDHTVDMDGPVEPGPSLYEWARFIPVPGGAPAAEGPAGTEDPAGADGGTDAGFLAEARRLGPDTYPSRAFYGRYLEAVFAQVVSGAPAHVSVRVHRSTATALDDAPDGTQAVTLADGTVLTGLDAVVLAQGHVPARPTAAERELSAEAAAAGLVHVLPAGPADVDLSGIGAGEPVLLRGLGLNFFDHLALLTSGRGGVFRRDGERLVYRPSGREPRLFAGSRRGVPYHARGENEKGAHGRHLPRLLTATHAAALRERAAEGGQLLFGADLWPPVAKEVESVYYGALLAAQGRPAERNGFVERYLAAAGRAGEAAVLDAYGIADRDRWDWDRVARPYGTRKFNGRADFRDWLLAYLREDVREARAGNVSGPLKAALDVLRDLRNEIRLAVDHGGLAGDSYRDDLQGWYTPLNAFLSIGPPVARIEELIALIEAGVVELLGPRMRVRVATAGTGRVFRAESDVVGGAPVHATTLIEARLPEPDLRRTADPLLRHLLTTGRARAYRIAGSDGTRYETGGLAVTERPYRTIDAAGRAHPRRFAYGVPTEGVHWVTAAGIRPGVNSVILGDSDAVAGAVLALGSAGRRTVRPEHAPLTEVTA
ncbi:FAD/NAD(P)-binding protein [Streptomyces niger]|uniref:FAD/NAD(P)-binding protein n=1 Tax=Streptomyces niger TaxID=66373 RepID=UPI00069B869D|nr:FAD/NAD(P)-binding protein [Streptomyces niger]